MKSCRSKCWLASCVAFLFVSFTNLAVAQDTITGKLTEVSNKRLRIKNLEGEEFDLKIPSQYRNYLYSLSENFLKGLVFTDERKKKHPFPEFFLRFSGKQNGSDFWTYGTPQALSGPRFLRGTLRSTDTGFYIGDTRVRFAHAIRVVRTSFDTHSAASFVGMEVEALAKEGTLDEAVVTAIIPANLYSASDRNSFSSTKAGLGLMVSTSLQKTVDRYLLKRAYEDHYSKGKKSYRVPIYRKAGTRVRSNDFALVISLSGRQADDTAALSGHLAAGRARVREDLSLDIEMWNFYGVPNEKLALASHGSHIDYFGNVSSGQNNYRPTYTLILYGVAPWTLKQMRNRMDDDLHAMRSRSREFGADVNCTTATVDALGHCGVKGELYNGVVNHVISAPTAAVTQVLGSVASVLPFLWFSPGTAKEWWDAKNDIAYVAWVDRNKLLPRPAFDGYLQNLEPIIRKLGVKRVDYIFQAQTPSERLRGGAPSSSIMRVKEGKDIYPETIAPGKSWSLKRIAKEVDRLMKD